MKKYKSLFKYLVILGVIFSSCKKSFLEKAPESSLAAGSIKSAQDAENLLNGAYNKLATVSYYQYDNFMLTDGKSDNCYVNGDNVTAEQPLENFTYTSSNAAIQGAWTYLFGHVTAANAVTDNIPPINDPSWAGTNRKEQILGEARFLRALAYYNLVTEFGGVPIILSVTNNGNFYPARNTAAEVYAQIIADLKFAEGVLPETPFNGQAGRATAGAADALLAKTYAQMGDYTNCLTYCNKVISGGKYSLVSDYSKLFGRTNKNTPESIFEVQAPSGGSPYNFFGPELFVWVAADQYPKRDIGSFDLIQAFKAAGDQGIRYKSTFNWQIANASFNMPLNAWDAAAPIPFIVKLPDAEGFASSDNLLLIRYADILLLAAEANNQLGNTGTAITLMNQVRTRANLPGTIATTKTELALAILNERRLELAHEQVRWNDLLRADANGTINLVTLMNSQVNSHGANLNYNLNADKHQFVYPIPLQDIQLNKNLTQNPGY
ncbi:RagB/SusD family nutrient uptake outer membrane protein [Mucilaginibacter sp. cycad4]|uniref:RagB/SusD family nutrient uptake outer membrane protein n=1 Tax=Mucilaginibacter sp. cycad4 TaxID=3342096 RepID=UPI002AAAD6BA|nr:RagB/SusD family nutrient uptake outer membrane protein [Mucilaginibacter gossypii]WPV01937.1 RagB/SusD family nutrient uptake outer membrane protein [Mucilaginibacter gossypii]